MTPIDNIIAIAAPICEWLSIEPIEWVPFSDAPLAAETKARIHSRWSEHVSAKQERYVHGYSAAERQRLARQHRVLARLYAVPFTRPIETPVVADIGCGPILVPLDGAVTRFDINPAFGVTWDVMEPCPAPILADRIWSAFLLEHVIPGQVERAGDYLRSLGWTVTQEALDVRFSAADASEVIGPFLGIEEMPAVRDTFLVTRATR